MQKHKSKIKMVTDGTRQATVFLLLVLCPASVSFAKYSGGTGEPNDPYRIATPNDLNDIGNHVEDFNKCFVMVNDINLADYTGTQFNMIGSQSTPFIGVFDGNEHAISNFTYTCSGTENVGLFAYVGDYPLSGEIRDVLLKDPNLRIEEAYRIGTLVGVLNEGHINRCSVERGRIFVVGARSISCDVGGLVGYAAVRAEMTGCRCNSELVWDNGGRFTSADIGGIVGHSFGADLRECGTLGTVTGGNWCRAGGLVGKTHENLVQECYSKSQVQAGGSAQAGGLIGRNEYSLISNCHATGSVSAEPNSYAIGGLIGINQGNNIITSYSCGYVAPEPNSGGLVGYHEYGSYTKCFWDSMVNPDVNGISNADDPNVIGKTTAEMMTESTFTDAGWDFVEVWDIGENQTYPFLRVHPAGDMNHDGIVDWRDLAILAVHWLEGL